MDSIFFRIFRRMRRPLLTLISAYTVAILGLMLIPGQDAQGNLWQMDLFHAFYFVSFMSTTIGFGEIPYPFTDGQRMWVIFSLYCTVIVWIYAIGALLGLIRDRAFQQALKEHRFARQVKQIREPFYLVCGYGETGGALVKSLTDRDRLVVVLDIDEERVHMLTMDNLRQFVPALHADAARPRHLLEAGLRHPLCNAVVALTNVNEVNLKIAITAKLLHPDVRVICRADSKDIEANMKSFGTNHIIDPFEVFGLHLATSLKSPRHYMLREWLSGERSHLPSTMHYPPATGRWVICGYGRFGKEVYRRLQHEGQETVVIEAKPEVTGMPDAGGVLGRGTEGKTLREAGIDRAVGLVAGTNDDANNLSIIMTARELRSDLYVVLRQNELDNQVIIDAARADMVMHHSAIIANRIRTLLGTPLLHEFFSRTLHQNDEWAAQLTSRIKALVNNRPPAVWEVVLDEANALAVHQALTAGRALHVRDLVADPGHRETTLPCILMLIGRKVHSVILPELDEALKAGDRLLFCGRSSAQDRMVWGLQNVHALDYILTGEMRSEGWLWRQLKRKGLLGG